MSVSGIWYYNELINGLLDAGIVPMVTMYHWDLPQALEDIDGWVNSTIVDAFVEYANVLFDNFGDRASVSWLMFVVGFTSLQQYFSC